jgi:hypothetical protein
MNPHWDCKRFFHINVNVNFAFSPKPLAPGFVYICVNIKMFAPPKKSMAETFLIGATWLKYIAEQQ